MGSLSNTLGSPVGGGGFNRSRAFRRAWDVGPRALGRPLGGCLEVPWGAFFTSWVSVGGVPGRAKRVPGRPWRPLGDLLEASWRPTGAPKAAWSAKGGLPGAYGSLLAASWSGLGGLLEPSWIVLDASWTPKGRPKEAQEVPKWSPGGVLNGKLWNLPKLQNS